MRDNTSVWQPQTGHTNCSIWSASHTTHFANWPLSRELTPPTQEWRGHGDANCDPSPTIGTSYFTYKDKNIVGRKPAISTCPGGQKVLLLVSGPAKMATVLPQHRCAYNKTRSLQIAAILWCLVHFLNLRVLPFHDFHVKPLIGDGSVLCHLRTF